MAYESNRKKLQDYFFNNIYPQMDTYGIDYSKTIFLLMNKLSISIPTIERFLKELIDSGEIIETRILELPKEEILRREKEVNKELEEIEGVLK